MVLTHEQASDKHLIFTETNVTLQRKSLDCPNITQHLQTYSSLKDRMSLSSFFPTEKLYTYPSESLVLVIWGWPSSSSPSGTRVSPVTSVYTCIQKKLSNRNFNTKTFSYKVSCHLKIFQNYK